MKIQEITKKLQESKEQFLKYDTEIKYLIKKVNLKEDINRQNNNLKLISCFLYSFIFTLFFRISLEYKLVVCIIITSLYKLYMTLNLIKYSDNMLKIELIKEESSKIGLEIDEYKNKIVEYFKDDLKKELYNNDCEFNLEIQENSENILLLEDIYDEYLIKEDVFYKYRLNEEQTKIKRETIKDENKIYLTNNDALIYYKELNSKILRMEEYILNNNEFLRLKKYLSLSKMKFSDYELSNNISILKSFKILDDILESINKLIKDRKRLIETEFNRLYSGYTGEHIVNQYLNLNKDKYINLNNIRLKVDEGTIENDNIILSNKGIFIVEVKNWGSSGKYDIEISKEGKWYKLDKHSKEYQEYEKSPFEQNKLHIEGLEKLINNKLNKQSDDYIKVKGLVVMSNNIVNIKNQSDEEVYRVSQINDYINSFTETLNDEELTKIKDIILSEKLEDAKQPYNNYKEEIEHNINIFKKLVILGLENIQILEIIFNKYIEYKDIADKYKINELNFDKFNDLYKSIIESNIEYDFNKLYNEKVNDSEDSFLEESDDKVLNLD